jgi:hypothetical protein
MSRPMNDLEKQVEAEQGVVSAKRYREALTEIAQLRHTLGFWREAYIEDVCPTEDWIKGTDEELAAYGN